MSFVSRFISTSLFSLVFLPTAFGQAPAHRHSGPLDPDFFATASLQTKAPLAFAVQPAALAAVHEFAQGPWKDSRDALLKALQSDPKLATLLARFDRLNWPQQRMVLKKVFAIETKSLGIQPPSLDLDNTSIRGPAFFEFDVNNPSAGKVMLNPVMLAKETNKFAALLLLVHETRHSAQFQFAFLNKRAARSPLAKSLREAFRAQNELGKDMSFCDFTTLLHEYESFQFGNYIVGQLTNWKVDTLDMGTFASQYDGSGRLKIDLIELARKVGPRNYFDAFNELEREQYERLKK